MEDEIIFYGNRKPPKALNDAEIWRLKEYAKTLNKRDYIIIRLMFESGLRACEVSRMKTEHLKKAKVVKTETNAVYTIKVKGKWRKRYDETVFISQSLMNAMIDTVNMFEKWVFTGYRGAGLSTRRIREIVKNAMKAAGLERHSAHHLRHTYANLMWKATGDLKTLQKQLRHKSPNLTAYYAGIFEFETKKNDPGTTATAVTF